MERIDSLAELIWIDHHVTALTDLQSLNDIQGTRALDEAACVLTWNTFFPDESVPKAVLYVGDRDIWRHEYPQTRSFGEGLYHENTDPDNDQVWITLLDDDHNSLNELISRGDILYKARIKRSERLISSKGFELDFEGYSTLVLNTSGTGDLGEIIRQQGYEIGYCYSEAAQNGEIVTFVTLYSDSVDVSKIARKFGGGGHKAAAGFSFRRDGSPFPDGSRFTLKT
jgi:oligoribonuclease NrnB/cAMP/cGMP phosphodiesterase (DHH superfamily)